MLNTAGFEYDYAHVVHAVLQECEHYRRGVEDDNFERDIKRIAQEKLARIKAAYDEIGGSPEYWATLEKEVGRAVLPQYAEAAKRITALERRQFDLWRGGDLAARAVYALAGLLIGSIIIALPFIPIFEDMFAFALTALGFIYPDLKRYMIERRHTRFLNRLVAESEQYQRAVRIRYMTSDDFEKALALPAAEKPSPRAGSRPSS